jgi:hypothetical protein
MSSKSKRPQSKGSREVRSVPRSSEIIQNEYSQLSFRAGQTQYQIGVYQDELKRMNELMRQLNYEAAARNQLDAQAAEDAKRAAEAVPSSEEAGVQ